MLSWNRKQLVPVSLMKFLELCILVNMVLIIIKFRSKMTENRNESEIVFEGVYFEQLASDFDQFSRKAVEI